MSHRRIKMDMRGIWAFGGDDSPQSGWLRRGYQDPSDNTAPATQQQRSPFTNPHVAIAGTADAFMPSYRRPANQGHFAEPPKGQRWPKPYTATIHGSVVQDLVIRVLIEAANDLAQRQNYSIDWPNVARLVSDREMPSGILRELFHSANYEVFEDGMDSDFSNSLNRIISDHGIAAVDALEKMISDDGVNPEVAAEALIWAGRMSDKATQHARLSMLERALESPNVCIRDAASIGIGAMDDPAAIDSLRKAIDRERSGLLRQNLKDTLEQLKDAR